MKKPLVLLHGWAMNSKIWQPIIADLEIRFEVFAIDLPGYGSEVNVAGEYSLDSVVQNVLDRVPARANWVGWSLGGTIALAAALKYPERIEKLQLISATPKFLNSEDWDFGVEFEPFEKVADQFEQNYDKAMSKFLLLQSNTSDKAAIGRAKTQVRETAKILLDVAQPSRETLRGGLKILAETDLRARISELKIPTQIVAGMHDRIVPKAASEYLANQLLSVNQNFPVMNCLNTGHLPFIESPTEYVGILDSFVAQ